MIVGEALCKNGLYIAKAKVVKNINSIDQSMPYLTYTNKIQIAKNDTKDSAM